MTSILSALPAIPQAGDHKQVVKQQILLRGLADKLTAARAHVADLEAQRKQARSAAHQDAVASHLGGGGGAALATTAPTDALDMKLDAAVAEVRAIEDAITMQTQIAQGIQDQIEKETAAAIADAVRVGVAELDALAEAIETRNLQLFQLANRAPGVLVPNPGFLSMWRQQAAALGGR